MRTHQTTDSELRQQLKDEIAHFKELDTKKDALWRGNVMENLQSSISQNHLTTHQGHCPIA